MFGQPPSLHLSADADIIYGWPLSRVLLLEREVCPETLIKSADYTYNFNHFTSSFKSSTIHITKLIPLGTHVKALITLSA